MKFKSILLQNHWADFNQTCHNASLGEGGSSYLNIVPNPISKGR